MSSFYSDGFAEGRRSGLCCVVPMSESVILETADAVLSDSDSPYSWRCYWAGMKRGFRLHYDDAHSSTVLAARRRHSRAV